MLVEELTKEDVEFFFNKYKYNSELIVNLERRLLKESYNYEKWHRLLKENSLLTRRLFAENQINLTKYVSSVLSAADQLKPETASFYYLHILFFLFENHNDILITDNLVTAIQYCPSRNNNKSIFASCLDLGISRVISNRANYDETEKLFNKAREQFPDLQQLDDPITKVHYMFCFLYQLLNECLAPNPNVSILTKTVNDAYTTLAEKMNSQVYAQMWNGSTDFPFHINLLKRFFKIYAIFGWYSSLNKNQNNNSDAESLSTIYQWISDEYCAEKQNGRINSMIFTAYHRMLFVTEKISLEEYVKILSIRYLETREIETQTYSYPDNSFPDDEDPVSSQFADVLDTVKIFSESFSFVFILMQELFTQTKDNSVKKQIRRDTEFYYILMPYSDKGIVLDPFIAENTKTILQSCENSEDCLAFLLTVFLHRQISTAIHFSMISRLSVLCYTHFSAARPELFSGIPGCETKDKAIQFVKEAGLCHDIGKLYCTNLVNLHFRKITDEEFSILCTHAKLGYDFIKQIPLLSKYADIVYGHHKWYDGTNGYPAEFDITKSPYKKFIDLITICDSIDAATDTLGRNYAKGKTFSVMLEELKTFAGTRYSPELVELLDKDETLKAQISEMTGEGRSAVYYEMYNQYISPHITFSSDDEKTVHAFSKEDANAVITFYKKCYPGCSESLLSTHLDSLSCSKYTKGYVLCDKRNLVYAVLFGRMTTPLPKLPIESFCKDVKQPENYTKPNIDATPCFIIDEILVLPNFRRKGYGTTMISFVENELRATGNIKIAINILKDFHEESFFWINGFCDTKYSRMEKDCSALPVDELQV